MNSNNNNYLYRMMSYLTNIKGKFNMATQYHLAISNLWYFPLLLLIMEFDESWFLFISLIFLHFQNFKNLIKHSIHIQTTLFKWKPRLSLYFVRVGSFSFYFTDHTVWIPRKDFFSLCGEYFRSGFTFILNVWCKCCILKRLELVYSSFYIFVCTPYICIR